MTLAIEMDFPDWLTDPEGRPIRVGSLLGLFVVVVLPRSYILGSVFRKGDVVLLGNDPYVYRYKVDLMVSDIAGIFDIGTFAAYATHGLPFRDPFLLITLAWWAELLGGGIEAAGVVLAWYPVVAAIIVVGLVYLITRRVAGNHWIGLIAGLSLAITPAFVIRTALGFSDHHAFDYVWLAVTALGLVWLATADRSGTWYKPWLFGGFIGLGVTGQVFSWIAGPILLVPVGMFIAVQVLWDVASGDSPLELWSPITGGLLVSSVVIYLGRSVLDQLPFGIPPSIYAIFVGGMTIGTLSMLVIGELGHRRNLSNFLVGLIEIAVIGVGVVTTGIMMAEMSNVTLGAELLTSVWTPGGEVAESMSLFGGPWGVITGPLSVFGLLLFLGLPYLLVATRECFRNNHPGWLVLVFYGWTFLVYSTFGRRFAGDLAMFMAPFVSIGFIDLTSRLGVIQEIPLFGDEKVGSFQLNNEQAIRGIYPIGLLIVLVVTASFIQIPIKMNQIVHDGDAHDAALAMRDHANEAGLTDAENYVLSSWGESRMYNYFVSGKVFIGKSSTGPGTFGHGKPTYWPRRMYPAFLLGDDGDRWYQRLQGNETAFIVTEDYGIELPKNSMYSKLHRNHASRNGDVAGVDHYRLIYVGRGGDKKAFMLVPGAQVRGTGVPDSDITISGNVEVNGVEFQYQRLVKSNLSGEFSVVVPYPGKYSIGNVSVLVSEDAVLRGKSIELAQN